MKRKCEACGGKGGHTIKPARQFASIFVSCQQCQGKGKWWDNKKPKRKDRQ